MAGLAEDGGEGGKGEIGFGGEPIGRKDEQDLHLPAAGGFEALAIEEDQLLGGSLTLRILDLHAGRTLPANGIKPIRKTMG
jgi:hypothetical protein